MLEQIYTKIFKYLKQSLLKKENVIALFILYKNFDNSPTIQRSIRALQILRQKWEPLSI